MIKSEIVEIDNRHFKHTYSNENYMIRKVGTDEIYTGAYDVLESSFQYVETSDKINDEDDSLNKEYFSDKLR